MSRSFAESCLNYELSFAESPVAAVSKLKAANLLYDIIIVGLDSSYTSSSVQPLEFVAIVRKVLGMTESKVIGLSNRHEDYQKELSRGVGKYTLICCLLLLLLIIVYLFVIIFFN